MKDGGGDVGGRCVGGSGVLVVGWWKWGVGGSGVLVEVRKDKCNKMGHGRTELEKSVKVRK